MSNTFILLALVGIVIITILLITSILIVINDYSEIQSYLNEIFNKKQFILKRFTIVGTVFLILLFGLFVYIGFLTYKFSSKEEYQEESTALVLPNIEKSNLLLEAIAEIESRNDTTAQSKISSAAGHLQILKVTVDECNRLLGEQKYSYKDRYSRKEAEEMFWIIQDKYNPKGDIETAIRLWNGGPNYSKESTQGYYEAVMKVYNRKLDEKLLDIAKHYKALTL